MVLTPILWTTAVVFGSMWLFDDDKVTTQRFDLSRARGDRDGWDAVQVRWGVGASADGGMLGLTVTW
jgi:hypothetical protein